MNAMLRVLAGQPRVLCGKWEWAPVCVLTRKWSGPLLPAAAAHFSSPDIDIQHWWRFCGNASQQMETLFMIAPQHILKLWKHNLALPPMRRFCDYREFRCTSKHRCHNSIVVLENTTCYWWLVGNCGSYSIWLASCSHQHTSQTGHHTFTPVRNIWSVVFVIYSMISTHGSSSLPPLYAHLWLQQMQELGARGCPAQAARWPLTRWWSRVRRRYSGNTTLAPLGGS